MHFAAALLLLLVMASSISAAGGKGSIDPAATLPAEMHALMDQPKYRGARWGIYVADQKSGQVIYDFNGNWFFVPGSTTKLFSAAAALDAYGPEFRFGTPVYRTGPIDARGRCGAI